MEKRLTIEEMYEKYPDKWLFITDCEISENTELLSGIVSVHSPNKEDILEASSKYEGGAAIRWTGKPDPNVVFIPSIWFPQKKKEE